MKRQKMDAEGSMPMSLLLNTGLVSELGSEGSSQGQLLQQLTVSPPFLFATDSQEHPGYAPQVRITFSVSYAAYAAQVMPELPQTRRSSELQSPWL